MWCVENIAKVKQMETSKKATWDGQPVRVVEVSMGQFAVESDAGVTLKTLDLSGLVSAVETNHLSFISSAGRRKTGRRSRGRKTRRYRK
jgi:hypothetical protein